MCRNDCSLCVFLMKRWFHKRFIPNKNCVASCRRRKLHKSNDTWYSVYVITALQVARKIAACNNGFKSDQNVLSMGQIKLVTLLHKADRNNRLTAAVSWVANAKLKAFFVKIAIATPILELAKEILTSKLIGVVNLKLWEFSLKFLFEVTVMACSVVFDKEKRKRNFAIFQCARSSGLCEYSKIIWDIFSLCWHTFTNFSVLTSTLICYTLSLCYSTSSFVSERVPCHF